MEKRHVRIFLSDDEYRTMTWGHSIYNDSWASTVGRTYMKFSIRANSDAMIVLTPIYAYTEAGVEIIIGTNGGNQTIIRNGIGPAARIAITQDTPNILDAAIWNAFWVSWDIPRRTVKVGTGRTVNQSVIAVASNLNNLQTVNAFGITSDRGTPVDWSFQDDDGKLSYLN